MGRPDYDESRPTTPGDDETDDGESILVVRRWGE